MNPTAWLLSAENRSVSILLVANSAYAALALGYSLFQWSYAARFRREWFADKLACGRQARHAAPGPHLPAVDVIVPCFNEKPEVLEACCEALERQREHYPGPIHVWLVDDGSAALAELQPVYTRFEGLPGWTVIRHERNRGKRRAQDSAFRRGKGDYVVTVDSDTTLVPKCVARLVSAMERNPRAGATSGHVTARNAGANRLTALIDRRYRFLFEQERAAQSWHRTVTCCSGPVSVYRREVLATLWNSYVDDLFLGRQRQFGDDLKLSLLVLEQACDSLYWPSARARTIVPETLRGYARQQVRWNKSFYRELPRADHALRQHRSSRYLELRRLRYFGRFLARYLGWSGAHRYVRFELAARALVPWLPPVLVAAGAWSALAVPGPVRWLPLLATVVVMLLHALVIGLKSGSFTFPVLYGLIHLTMLTSVRLRALATLTDSRWGTRGDTGPRGRRSSSPSARRVRRSPAPPSSPPAERATG